MIYLLGDIPSHHVWNQTDADQLASYDVLMQLLHKYFDGATFFPAIGKFRLPSISPARPFYLHVLYSYLTRKP